MFNDTVP